MKTKEEVRFNVRTTKEEKAALTKIAAAAKIPQSVIVREAIAEKVANLNALIQQGGTISVGVVSK